jgi:hypothetical protein
MSLRFENRGEDAVVLLAVRRGIDAAAEDELVRPIAGGVRRAFDELYRRTSPGLLIRLRRRCDDDLEQETYLVVWRASGSFTGSATSGSAVGWLWTIAAHRLGARDVAVAGRAGKHGEVPGPAGWDSSSECAVMTTHPSPAVIARGAGREAELDEATMWSVELHLEDCGDCRALVAGSATQDAKGFLDRIAAAVDRSIGRTGSGPPPAPGGGAEPADGLAFDAVAHGDGAGLCGPARGAVAATVVAGDAAGSGRAAVRGGHRVEPAPRSGPETDRRYAGGRADDAVAAYGRGAFTAATIALGCRVGVRLAVVGLGTAWALAVVVPAVATAELPAIWRPGSSGVWALLILMLAGFAATRANNFRRLSSPK